MSLLYINNNVYSINNTELSQGKWFYFATIAKGRRYASNKLAKKIYIFSMNQISMRG